VQPPAFLDDRFAQARDGGARHLAVALELVEVDQGDVELANGAQRTRQALHEALQLATARARDHERKRLAEPPRRDAGVV
jgi:hypothetical protein